MMCCSIVSLVELDVDPAVERYAAAEQMEPVNKAHIWAITTASSHIHSRFNIF